MAWRAADTTVGDAVEDRFVGFRVRGPGAAHVADGLFGRGADAAVGDGDGQRSARPEVLGRFPLDEPDRLAVGDDRVVDAAGRAVVEPLALEDDPADLGRFDGAAGMAEERPHQGRADGRAAAQSAGNRDRAVQADLPVGRAGQGQALQGQPCHQGDGVVGRQVVERGFEVDLRGAGRNSRCPRAGRSPRPGPWPARRGWRWPVARRRPRVRRPG